eukprot:1234887-Rhodomonas_salina.7
MDGVALAISPVRVRSLRAADSTPDGRTLKRVWCGVQSLERPGTGKNTLRLRGGSTKVQNATGGGGQ